MKTKNTDNKEFTDFRKQLGARIQGLRKEKRMTQLELAGECDLDRVSIGYIEQGIRTPKLRTLFLIARALDIKLSDFFQSFGR